MQDVPVRAQSVLHSLNLHPGGDIHRALLCHHSPHQMQADSYSKETGGKSQSIFRALQLSVRGHLSTR